MSDRIKKVRTHLECSQLVFSKALGVSRGHVSKLERGTAVPSKQLINLICATWDVDKGWLIEGEGDMKIGRKSNITAQECNDILIEDADFQRYNYLENNLRLLSDFIQSYTNFFDMFGLSHEASFDTLLDPGNDRNKMIVEKVGAIEKDVKKMMDMIKKLTSVPADGE